MRGTREGAPEEVDAEPEPVNRSEGLSGPTFTVVPRRPASRMITALASLHHGAGVAGTEDGTVFVFDVPSGRVRASRRLFGGFVGAIFVRNEGRRIIINGSSGPGEEGVDENADEVVAWDLDTNRALRLEPGHGDRTVSPDGQHVASTTANGSRVRVSLQTIGGGSTEVELEGREADAAFFAPDGRTFYVHQFGRLHRFSVPELRPRGEPVALPERRFAVNPSQSLVAGVQQKRVVVRDLNDGTVRHTLEFDGSVGTIQWSADGERLGVCERTRVHVHDRSSYEQIAEFGVGNTCGHLDLRDPDALASLDTRIQYRPAEGETFEISTPDGALVAFPPRGAYFLFSEHGSADVKIANITRRRARTLVGRGSSALHARPRFTEEGTISFAPRVVRRSAAPSTPAALPELDEHTRIGASEDGNHVVAVMGENDVYLLSGGAPEPVVLRVPRRWDNPCYAYGGELSCDGRAVFSFDASSFVVNDSSTYHAFDTSGRRLGSATRVFDVEYLPDGRLLVVRPGGALELTGTDFRRQHVVMRPRESMSVQRRVSSDGTLLAATRGAALLIYDLSENERKLLLTLPGRHARGAPPLFVEEDAQVQIQLEDGFIWYSLANGEELRRIRVENVRAIDDTRTHVLHCHDDRLRHRELSAESGTDLGPCPEHEWLQLDEDRVWWQEGPVTHFVRIADAQHLIVSSYGSRDPLRFAYTPRGHFWASRSDSLDRVLTLRGAGPILDAELSDAAADRISATLLEDFFAGRDLGDP